MAHRALKNWGLASYATDFGPQADIWIRTDRNKSFHPGYESLSPVRQNYYWLNETFVFHFVNDFAILCFRSGPRSVPFLATATEERTRVNLGLYAPCGARSASVG
jgi:hypothetical protein